jgi:hypothetical protein
VYIDVCIFVQTSLACKQPFDTLCRAALPFIGLMLGSLALLI